MATDKTKQSLSDIYPILTGNKGSALPEKAQWQYTGDVNIEYGGAYLDLSDWEHGYVSAVRVTDLDGGIGFDGAVHVELLTLYIDNEAQNRRALDCCGWIREDVDTSTDDGKMQLADAIMSYGYYDVYGVSETIQTLDDGAMEFDGWKADKRVSTNDLRGYIESKYDCEVQP